MPIIIEIIKYTSKFKISLGLRPMLLYHIYKVYRPREFYMPAQANIRPYRA
jgi:hypothetical protein